jgi:hypothetical protein
MTASWGCSLTRPSPGREKRVETLFEGFEMTGLKFKLKTCSEAEALAKKV